MRSVLLSKPEIGLVAVTRGLLGIGVGLLLSSRLPGRAQRVAGWTLLATGVVTTFPLLALMLRRSVNARA
jgi:hypothetical protein